MIRSVAFGVAVILGTTVLAAAQSADEQALCKDDAFRICSATIPDRERTFECMIANKDLLSPACRTVMARFLPPDPPQKTKRARKAQGQGQKQGQGPVNLSPTAAR
jgi:hypothetical protein